MGFDSIAFVIITLAGLCVCFAGINIYRYAIIIMGGAGGFALGRIVCMSLIKNIAGEGVFADMDVSAADSFVIAFFVIGGCALGFALYEIMGVAVAGIGAAFLLAKGFQSVMGVDLMSVLIGSVLGIFIGCIIGFLAVQRKGFWAILFTALAGARIVGYAASHLLAKPIVGVFQSAFPADAVRMAIAVELFAVLTIIGLVVQLIVRQD